MELATEFDEELFPHVPDFLVDRFHRHITEDASRGRVLKPRAVETARVDNDQQSHENCGETVAKGEVRPLHPAQISVQVRSLSFGRLRQP